MGSNLVDFKELVGKHRLYGIDLSASNDVVRFNLDGQSYEAYLDPDDGWRSYLGSIKKTQKRVPIFTGGSAEGVAITITENTEEYIDTWLFTVDATNELVFELGTDYSVEWYPCAVSYFNPKALGLVSE